jgi:hypothetical protein
MFYRSKNTIIGPLEDEGKARGAKKGRAFLVHEK